MEFDEREALVAAVRRRCLDVAQQAYEDAAMAGLCAEGRWEAARDAMRSFELAEVADGSRGDGSAG